MELQQKIVTRTTNTPPILLLDCCTIVSALEGDAKVLEFKARLSKRKDLTLLAPDHVISEVAKVARMSVQEAEKAVRAFAHGNKVTGLAEDKQILVDAVALGLRYDYCHYPDSIYLAHCRNQGAVLVTYDKKLKDVARMEGIMACLPENFRF
jgi:predicted nucleic acid-binding protein